MNCPPIMAPAPAPSRLVPMRRGAIISECGKYRYALGRQWDELKPAITWVMLNPSTADADRDDPTIRRCVEFSARWGFGTLNVVNLFAFRATSPLELRTIKLDIIGPENDAAITESVAASSVCMLAWGTFAMPGMPARVADLYHRVLKPAAAVKMCIGATKNGSPRHPLYLAKDSRVMRWGLK